MRYFKALLLCVLFMAFSCKKKAVEKTGIIPQPNFINYQDGTFLITENTTIVAEDSKEGNWNAAELKSFLDENFDLNIEISSESQSNAIQLIVNNDETDDEAYQLEVSKSGVLITANSYHGVFYGIQTLKQLLTPKTIIKKPVLNFVDITDGPEFGWRGMMLDVSRHFLEKDSVKKVIDILAMHKMNKLHWHLVDGIGWRIEIDKYPELTKKGAWRKVKEYKKPWEDFEVTYKDSEGEIYGGFYTKDDIKEIVAYAAERYIDVIPEIEMPGHSEAALQCYPEFICEDAENTGVYCAGNDGSFEFLQNIIDEVVELFPYQYLHIGGDEVGKEAWLNCKRCQKRMRDESLQNGEELQSYFVKRMEKFVHSKDRKLIGWDEILEGGLPERAAVMSWRGFEGGIEAANAGHDVVMSPAAPLYFDYNQGTGEFEPPAWGGYNNLLAVYNFNPVPDDIAADKRHHILGGQANLWTEQIKSLSHIEYMMLPRLSALSEALWTAPDQKNEEEFIKNIDVHFDRLKALGYNFAWSALSPDYKVTYDKNNKNQVLELNNELGIYDIRYTLDGSEPSMTSELYSKPIHYSDAIDLYAQTFRNGEAIGFPLKKLLSTKFTEKTKVTYINPYNESYSGGGDQALFDNKYGNARGDDSNWQGLPQKDFEVIMDLGETTTLSYIGLNFFQHLSSTSVMLPTEVTIEISKDGKNYQTVYNQTFETIKDRDPIIKRIETDFEKQNVSIIKITAKNRGQLPEWHIREGDAWIFVDEVSIR
ncbi:glycoside hydrolase family 20 protein [Gelidibacter pelagius]|uniref:beta-N-acetylhexosaminidase n=1 Tax=Gelidibacter pelagius TaxID=2819985 RepID=A0ABS3SNW4_9FLAO|nr:family 20 glycosylhydrolase [Gelidibacter pelagius]MBO3097397.1 family 20 glycosylhydrolase [Gelidibacter pelagius]